MKTHQPLAVAAAAVLAPVAWLSAPHAHAQPTPPRAPSFIGVGAASAPEFEGSKDQQVVPLVIGVVQAGSTSFRLTGLGVQWNLAPAAPAGWSFGPSINARMARDDGVDDPVVARLRKVDNAAELGGFVEYAWPNLAGPSDRFSVGAEVLKDVADAHDGVLGRFTASYQFAPAGDWRFGVRAGTIYADDNYMSAYFGIDSDNALRSGLPHYRAEAGLKDVSLGLTASYALPQNWMLTGLVSTSWLLGDAADSPIVTERGRDTQWLAGLAVGKRF
jgi:outer membrane protein